MKVSSQYQGNVTSLFFSRLVQYRVRFIGSWGLLPGLLWGSAVEAGEGRKVTTAARSQPLLLLFGRKRLWDVVAMFYAAVMRYTVDGEAEREAKPWGGQEEGSGRREGWWLVVRRSK